MASGWWPERVDSMCAQVHDNDPVKSVSNERTFATDVRSPDEVEGALAALAAKVGQRLRRKGLVW